MDPGWPGIEQDLKNVATIPILTRKAWLKQKRETGEFENCFPRRNAKPRCSVSQVKKKTKASSSSSDVRSVDMKSQPRQGFFSDAERLKFFFLPLQFPMLQVLKPVAGCIDVDDWKAGK